MTKKLTVEKFMIEVLQKDVYAVASHLKYWHRTSSDVDFKNLFQELTELEEKILAKLEVVKD